MLLLYCSARWAAVCISLHVASRDAASSVLGILKGFDQMMNVVLENCVEFLR